MSAADKNLQDDFLTILQESGLDGLAAEAGITDHNGDIAAGRPNMGAAAIATATKAPAPIPALMPAIPESSAAPLATAVAKRSREEEDEAAIAISTALVPNAAGPSGVQAGESYGQPETPAKKKRLQRPHNGDKHSKGLRHFSMKVCEKVEQKGRTTYNEVADELVNEFGSSESMVSPIDQAYDEKNIRRRVYDALNVLMAMDIIAKEKKNIMWRGLPTNAKQEMQKLIQELENRKERIEKKRLHLQELLTQQISFKNLIQRNKQPQYAQEQDKVCLPFIIINTRKHTVIDCEMAEDKQDIFFNFSMPFEIHDDNEILKRMGMHQCQLADLPHLVPPALIPFTTIYQMHHQPPRSMPMAPGGGEPPMHIAPPMHMPMPPGFHPPGLPPVPHPMPPGFPLVPPGYNQVGAAVNNGDQAVQVKSEPAKQ